MWTKLVVVILTQCNPVCVCVCIVNPQVGVHCARLDRGAVLFVHPVVRRRRQRQPRLVRLLEIPLPRYFKMQLKHKPRRGGVGERKGNDFFRFHV